MPEPYPERWDQRPNAKSIDCGDFGEDADGCWASIHPMTAYAERPRLVRPVEMFRMGVHAIDHALIDKLSAFELDCLIEIVSAYNRAQAAEMNLGGANG